MKKNIFLGKFIVFEGIDGAGKSTQARLLFNFLKKIKKKVYLTSEPTNSIIGNFIKKILTKKSKISPFSLQLFFCADRAYHLENEILPALKKGINVICDRYFFSTIAYGALEIKELNWLFSLNEKFILPDLTFLLKISAKESFFRLKKERKSLTLFEQEQKLAKIGENYLKLAKKFPSVIIIDGEKPIKEVFLKIKNIILKKLSI